MFLLPLFCILAGVSSAPSTESPAGVSGVVAKESSNAVAPLSSKSSDGITKEDSSVPITTTGEDPTEPPSVFSIPSEHASKEDSTQPGATSDENSKEVKESKKPILGHNVVAYEYSIPEGMYKENVDSNDWIWFLRYPEYTLDFHYYCLYHVVKEDEVERIEPGVAKDCVCTVQLSYWIEGQRKEVYLDTYQIPFKDGTEALTENSIVISHPKGNVHSIALAMTDGKCRQMQYTVDDLFSVKLTVKETDCKEVEKMKLENDEWTETNMPKRKEKENSVSTDKGSVSDSVPSADTQGPKKSELTEGAPTQTDLSDAKTDVTAPAVEDTSSVDTTTKETHSLVTITKATTFADTTTKDTHSDDTNSKDSDSLAINIKDTTPADTVTKDTHSLDTKMKGSDPVVTITKDTTPAHITTADINAGDTIIGKATYPITALHAVPSGMPNIDSSSVKESIQSADSTQVLSSPNSHHADSSSPDKQNTDTSNLIKKYGGSVIASMYTLPKGPFREHPFSNHWVSFDEHPTYSLNFFLYCPYELEPYENLMVRHANLEECRSVVRLYKYSTELQKEIVVDSYKIKEEYINQEVMDSIKIEEAEENRAVVMLTMVKNKCRRKTYEMLPDGLVKAQREVIKCEEEIVEIS